MQDLTMAHPLASPDLKLRIEINEAIVRLEAVQRFAPSIVAAGRLADVIRDLHALLIALEADPKSPLHR